MKRSILAGMLLCALLAGGLTACTAPSPAQPGSDSGSETGLTTAPPADTDPADTKITLAVTEADFENEDWNVLSYARQAEGTMWQYLDFGFLEDKEGNVLNEALYRRNAYIEDTYKIKICITEKHAESVRTQLSQLLTAGDATFDAAQPIVRDAFAAAAEGELYNLLELDELQTNAPWWDQSMISQLSLGGKLYVLSGDISLQDEEFLYAIFYNKKRITDLNLENPYTLVKEGKWTLDKLYELSAAATSDSSGDGSINYKDSYGFGASFTTAPVFFYAAGGSIARVDESGTLTPTLMSEKSESVIDRLGTVFTDRQAMIDATLIPGEWSTLNTMFTENRLLFRQGNIYNITAYREMVADFGVLPLPKFDEEQKDYAHIVATNFCPGIVIPSNITGERLERCCVLLTAFGANSADLTEAYYEINLNKKMARDEESGQMLEIIFSSKCYDIGKAFDWENVESSVIGSAVRFPGTFASSYEKVENKILTGIEESTAFFCGDE